MKMNKEQTITFVKSLHSDLRNLIGSLEFITSSYTIIEYVNLNKTRIEHINEILQNLK